MNLKLDQIDITDLQVRVTTDDATVQEYSDSFLAGVKMPPVVAFHDGQAYFLADGFHRLLGAKKAGLKDINAEVKKGGRKDALWYAVGANIGHGLKRTNADKRRAVEIALSEKPEMANRAIAKHVSVNEHLVAEIRDAATASTRSEKPAKEEKRVGSDGVTRKVPTRKVKPAAPTPAPAPEPEPEEEKPRVQCATKTVDATGLEVPAESLASWNRWEEDEDCAIIPHIASVRLHLEKKQKEKDNLYTEIDFTDDIAKLKSVEEDLKRVKPYAVCHSCNGKLPKGCSTCKGRGFVSKFYWDTFVPAEIKKLRGGK